MERLFWKKYRPKTMEEIILLPRIKKAVDNGIKNSMIFYGSYGMGKTALANILMKDNPHIKFNASLDTSIDILRHQVDEFCSQMSMFDDPNAMKIVFLDEVERTSKAYQEALKGFIEEYERNVRFIATTNHVQKVDKGIMSRFIAIDFNPRNNDEISFLKREYAKKLRHIAEVEEIQIETEDIVTIVNKNFPDLRQMVNIMQHIKETGEVDFNSAAYKTEMKDELFKHVMKKGNDFLSNYNFVMSTFGPENVVDMVFLLGRPFIEYAISQNTELLDRMQDIVEVVTEYSDMVEDTLDPIVLGVSLIGKIQKIVHA
jgi:replication-associated recombination protein RarA